MEYLHFIIHQQIKRPVIKLRKIFNNQINLKNIKFRILITICLHKMNNKNYQIMTKSKTETAKL